MKLLGIDTSGKVASAALCDENAVLAQSTIITKLTHSQIILPLVKQVLASVDTELSQVDGFAIASGPGSYTGLRIGISAVKAMAFALDKPCLGVSTLESLAYNFLGFEGRICAVMTARLELLYAADFCAKDGETERLSEDRIIPAGELFEEISSHGERVMLVGDAAEKFYNLYSKYNDRLLTLASPHLRLQLASSLCLAAQRKPLGRAVDLNAQYLQPTQAEKELENGGKL